MYCLVNTSSIGDVLLPWKISSSVNDFDFCLFSLHFVSKWHPNLDAAQCNCYFNKPPSMHSRLPPLLLHPHRVQKSIPRLYAWYGIHPRVTVQTPWINNSIITQNSMTIIQWEGRYGGEYPFYWKTLSWGFMLTKSHKEPASTHLWDSKQCQPLRKDNYILLVHVICLALNLASKAKWSPALQCSQTWE